MCSTTCRLRQNNFQNDIFKKAFHHRNAFFIHMKKITYTIPLIAINIEESGCQLLVKAEINRKKLHLILDTGASQTVFDKKRMEAILGHNRFRKAKGYSTGLGTQSMESHLVRITDLKMPGALIKSVQAVLLDLSHVNSAYSMMKMKTIDGVLGGDILQKYNAVIDYGKMELTLQGGRGIKPVEKKK